MSDALLPHGLQHTRSPCPSFTICWSLLKLMSIESVMSSSHLVLCHPLHLLPSIFPSIRFFSNESKVFTSGGQSVGASVSASVFPMSIQGWFPLRLTDLISLVSKGPQEPSPAPQFEGISSSALHLLYGPALITIRDHWEDHCLDYTDLCQQSNVSAFNALARFVIAFLS